MDYTKHQPFIGEISATRTIDGVPVSLSKADVTSDGNAYQFIVIDGLQVGRLATYAGHKVHCVTVYYTYANGHVSMISVDGTHISYVLDLYRAEYKHFHKAKE